MTMEKRVSDLEQRLGEAEGPTRILVLYGVPDGLTREEEEAWMHANPDDVKMIEVPPQTTADALVTKGEA
jgi:hypothetical protein